MEKILMQDFVTIILPDLEGTKKQIKFANKIRKKVIEKANKDLNNISSIDTNTRKSFIKALNDNIQNLTNSSDWIKDYCPLCGCELTHSEYESICSNSEYCTYSKENKRY